MRVCFPLSLTIDCALLPHRADEVRGQRVVDHLQPGIDGHGVIGGAILPQQVLKDEDRHIRATFTLRTKSLRTLCRQTRKPLFRSNSGIPYPYIEIATSTVNGAASSAQWWHRAVDCHVSGKSPQTASPDSIRFDSLLVVLRNFSSLHRSHLQIRTRHPQGAKRTSC